MIYGASLGPFIKKAFLEKGFQTNINKIIQSLAEDPKISNMDAVILSPKDLKGPLAEQLNNALKSKHPSVKVVFFHRIDKEDQLIEGDVMKLLVPKVTPEKIEEVIQNLMGTDAISSDNRIIQSTDEKTQAGKAIHVDQSIETEVSEVVGEELPALDPKADEEFKTLEQRISEMGQYADFQFFRQSLQKDHILADLMDENSQYANLIHLLEALDQKILNVFKDISLTAEARFEEVKRIGIDRSAYKGIEIHMLADKLLSIMQSIIHSAEAAVDMRIDNIRKALDTISTVKLVFKDKDKLEKLLRSRIQIQMDLMELSKEIIEVYKAMDSSVHELLQSFEEGLPADNQYVNQVMEPIKPLFTPQNIAAVTSKLIGDLQRNKVSLSIMEDKITRLIDLVFKLCEEDATIIQYQQKLIQLLITQKVEDVVIVDSVIKNALRLFVGPSEVGRTATAVTWSGVVSRRQNTLLIDLSGSSKLEHYGVEPLSLDEFLVNRIERPHVCVEGQQDHDFESINKVVGELKTRLNYYAHIHIILDSAQTELLQQLSSSALTIHFITDCTPRGMKLLKQSIETFTEENIARKVILIDPPLDPVRILSDLSVDPLLVKLIVIPRLQHIRACSLNNMKPYESKEVVEVFEEAFR